MDAMLLKKAERSRAKAQNLHAVDSDELTAKERLKIRDKHFTAKTMLEIWDTVKKRRFIVPIFSTKQSTPHLKSEVNETLND
jgi:hypothetical protein